MKTVASKSDDGESPINNNEQRSVEQLHFLNDFLGPRHDDWWEINDFAFFIACSSSPDKVSRF